MVTKLSLIHICDRIAQVAHSQGYKAIVTEGAKHLLAWKSPNYLYNAATEGLSLIHIWVRVGDTVYLYAINTTFERVLLTIVALKTKLCNKRML